MNSDSQKEEKVLDLSINKIDLTFVVLSRDSSRSHGH